MRNTYEPRAVYKKRMETMRKWKREREEARKWKRFEISREAFDDRIEEDLDAFELIMRNQDGCGW
jgi:hypothetical protein